MASVNEHWNLFSMSIRQTKKFRKAITYNDEMFVFFLLLHLSEGEGLVRETPFFETSEYSDYDFPQDLEGRSHFETVIAALKHSHEYFLRMEKVAKKKGVLPRCDNQEFMTD